MSTDLSEVRAASVIALMIEAACTSETSVDIYLTTWQYIPEDSELHTRHHENLKSHMNLNNLITVPNHLKTYFTLFFLSFDHFHFLSFIFSREVKFLALDGSVFEVSTVLTMRTHFKKLCLM
jgi:hypothetical protein